MKLACCVLCGVGMIGLVGCASNKPSLNEKAPEAGSRTSTTRTLVPTYLYDVAPSTTDAFKVSLIGLELVSTLAFKSQSPSRESTSGTRVSASISIAPIESSSNLAWRQCAMPRITEVIDERGTDVFVSSKEDYNFRSKVFSTPRMNGIGNREDGEQALARINAVLMQLPRAIKSMRGEALVEVASSIVTKEVTLATDPVELEVCEGVRAKLWRTAEKNQFDKLISRVNLAIRFSAERQRSGAIIHALELSNATSGKETIKLTESFHELTQTLENDELVVRGSTDRLRAEDGPVSVRISVIPAIQRLTIPFAFHNLPGTEP